MHRALLAALLSAALLLPGSAAAATVRVGVVEDPANDRWGFRPPDLTVGVGDTVEFVNDGREIHNVVAADGRFESPSLAPGAVFRVALDRAGDVAYVCTLHTRMEGSIRVRAAAAAPAAPPVSAPPAPAAPPPAAAPPAPAAAPVASAADFAVPGGWFYAQAGGGGGRGYAVTDEGGVRFWSELRRLGGVRAVGYPASRRFRWDGFEVQVFQRVVFQWRPESGAVAFVNVFDRLHELGRDGALLRSRQTPPPRAFAEAGLPWERVVAGRLAVMDRHPAIRAAYDAAAGDPVQANGLPTSDVVDMGNHLALRAQRVVLQQWTEDVPWARAGQVTVALGGDIAKELGILPDPDALLPAPPPPAAAAAGPSLVGALPGDGGGADGAGY